MKRVMTLFFCVICFSLLAIASSGATTVVVDTFGVGDTYDPGWGPTITNGCGEDAPDTQGFPFTPSVTGFVSDIWLAVVRTGSLVDNKLDVALMTDSGGSPGAVLETWNFDGQLGLYSDFPLSPPLHGPGAGTTELSAGSKYWLIASPPSATGCISNTWGFNTDGTSIPRIHSSTVGFGGPWGLYDPFYPGAFRVAVDEGLPACDLSGAVTFGQGGWSVKGQNSPLTASFFSDNFPDGLVIGETGCSVKLTTVAAAINFLAASGTPSALPSGNAVNPTYKQIKNTLAGQAVAATLNLALSPMIGDAEIQPGYGIPFEGETVNDLLDAANQALGGAASTKTQLSNLTKALDYVNHSFDNGYDSGYLACP